MHPEVYRGISTVAEEISDFGIEVVYYFMHSTDEAEQLQWLEKIKNSNISGLILKPVNYPSIRQQIDEIAQRGIPVVTCTSDINNSRRTAFVGHDHRKEGRMLARLLGMILKPKCLRSDSCRRNECAGTSAEKRRISGVSCILQT